MSMLMDLDVRSAVLDFVISRLQVEIGEAWNGDPRQLVGLQRASIDVLESLVGAQAEAIQDTRDRLALRHAEALYTLAVALYYADEIMQLDGQAVLDFAAGAMQQHFGAAKPEESTSAWAACGWELKKGGMLTICAQSGRA